MKNPTNFHTSMITYCLQQQHLVNSRSEKRSAQRLPKYQQKQ